MKIEMQPGAESLERLQLVLWFARMKDNTEKAMIDYFVKGYTPELLAFLYGIDAPNITRAANRLNDINHQIEQVKNYDFYQISDKTK